MTTTDARPSVQARTWTLAMPPTLETLNSNDRGTYKQRIDLTRELRDAATTMARAAKMPTLCRARIVAVWESPDNRRYDPANLYPTAKAYVDGLVSPDRILPDDDSWHVIGPDMRAGHLRPVVGRMTLHITELPPLFFFDCTSPKAAAAVTDYSTTMPIPGIYGEHRARWNKRQVTVMYTDPRWLAELAAWAWQRGHTETLAYPQATL